MPDIEYDFDEYPFTIIFADGIDEVPNISPKQLNVTDDVALDLAIKVLEDPFFSQYLNYRVKEKLNSGSAKVLREGLSSARGFQYKITRLLEEGTTEAVPAPKPAPTPQKAATTRTITPITAETKAKRTREVTPVTDETKAQAMELLESNASGIFPDRLRILLSRDDENLVREAILIARDILKGRGDLRKAHAARIEALTAEHQGEVQDIHDAHTAVVNELEKRISILVRENTVLREQVPAWVINTQRRLVRLKAKARRMVAAAREDEPIMELPGHGGDPTPHLMVVAEGAIAS